MAAVATEDFAFALVCTALDPDFYRSAYPDIAEAGADPFVHYARTGWREGRDPAPWFSTTDYLAANPDVVMLDVNPLAHYLTAGAGEGREVKPSSLGFDDLNRRIADGPRTAWRYDPPPPPRFVAAPPVAVGTVAPATAASPEPAQTTEAQRELAAAAFDARYYLAENPDVAREGGDALAHFLATGWREGRDPAPWFSVADYQELNPDVAASGMNPFVHYLQAGRAEGRLARLDLGFRHKIIAGLQPLQARLEAVAAHDRPVAAGEAETLSQAFALSRSGWADLHVTVSHDDYSINLGGVQLCIQREAAAAAATGRDHLHLYPINSRPMLRAAGDDAPVGVLWNGAPVGAFAIGPLVQALKAQLEGVEPGRRSLAIHSLLGHRVDDVLAVAGAMALTAGWFWVHDFASACVSYHLLRNDVSDCGAPPPGSAACGVCLYGEARAFHMDEHGRLFAALDLSVAAPSQTALDTWRRGTGLAPGRAVVAPLAQLSPRPAEPGGRSRARQPFRLAFPGLPSTLKGWPVFRELVLRFAEDPRYEFLHLARDASGGLPLSFHSVTVSEAQPKAMQAALESLGVDAVMIWSLCRETFSFTTHEAAAAGAAILTGPDSGNVAAFVEASGQGRVLEDEAALFEMFETGAVLDLRRSARRPVLCDLSYSRLTIDLLDGEAGQ
ncbi:hypothetical protein [Phenylobacterium sp.]|uniref:hypothetical protein n=1 Tax=Phenylobacterium sp. TaxID=1871053 RepID=UPI002613C72B|nr:hypothetical protein [Phenylobacterium sp.]